MSRSPGQRRAGSSRSNLSPRRHAGARRSHSSSERYRIASFAEARVILVTGAAGKTGLAVIRALLARHAPVRAFVRNEAQQRHVTALGVLDTAIGDLRVGDDVKRAADGVAAMYLICPNMTEDEETLAVEAITSGRSMGVEHIVYHSVLHPQTEAMPHHWQKLRVEQHLLEANVPFTILQPAAYMQNVLAAREQIVTRGLYPVPYAAGTKLGMVDLVDVAEVAATVLIEAGHVGSTYELAGPEVMTQTSIAQALGRGLGRVVKVASISREDWEKEARAAGLTREYAIKSLLAMFKHYEEHGFWGNPRVLEFLLGRPATRFAAFVDRCVVNP